MGYIATGMLGLLMVLTVANIVLRDIFNKPIRGTPELSEFIMVIVIFLALAWCAITRQHVRVELVVTRLPLRVQIILNSITLFITLGIFVIITPIIVSHMLGKKITGYECGVHLGNNYFSPYSRVSFLNP